MVVALVTPLLLAPPVGVADHHRMNLQAVWIGIGAAALVIGAILLFFRGSSSEGLGMVSDQWVGQHRGKQLDDLER